MPVKRRHAKARSQYPEAVQRLIKNLPIAKSEESRDAMLAVVYLEFSHFPEHLRARALDILLSWNVPRTPAP